MENESKQNIKGLEHNMYAWQQHCDKGWLTYIFQINILKIQCYIHVAINFHLPLLVLIKYLTCYEHSLSTTICLSRVLSAIIILSYLCVYIYVCVLQC